MMPSHASSGGDTAAGRGGRRILYLSKHFGYPLGGVRIAHHHVEILARNGFDARILLIDGESDAHFSGQVVAERLHAGFAIRPSDLYVIPEPWDGRMRRLKPDRKSTRLNYSHYFAHSLPASACNNK